jgi:hypothetical protein
VLERTHHVHSVWFAVGRVSTADSYAVAQVWLSQHAVRKHRGFQHTDITATTAAATTTAAAIATAAAI